LPEIHYPSVFLSEHDPELAKGKCESKDPDTVSFANAASGSSTDTCCFVVDKQIR